MRLAIAACVWMIVAALASAQDAAAVRALVPDAVYSQQWRVARLTVPDVDGGGQSRGSGVIINGQWLLTARHCWEDNDLNTTQYNDPTLRLGREASIDTFRHGQRRVFLRAWSSQYDYAACQIHPPLGEVEPLPIAEPPAPGSLAWSAGYSRGGDACVWLQMRASETMYRNSWEGLPVQTGVAVGGNSGGPCFDADGRLCGILWGSSEEGYPSNMMTSFLQVAELLPEAVHATEAVCRRAPLRALLPWNARTLRANIGCQTGVCPQPQSPQQPPPMRPVQGQPGPAGPPGPAGQITDDQLTALFERVVTALKDSPSLKGEQGDPGRDAVVTPFVDPSGNFYVNGDMLANIRGPAGPRGPAGSTSDGVLLRVEYVDSGGNVVSREEYRRGDTLILFSGNRAVERAQTPR